MIIFDMKESCCDIQSVLLSLVYSVEELMYCTDYSMVYEKGRLKIKGFGRTKKVVVKDCNEIPELLFKYICDYLHF